MAGEKYTVEGELRIRAEAGVASVRRLADRLTALRSTVAGSQSIVRGLVGSVVSLGAGYVGINALAGAFRGVVGGAVEFQGQLESTRIGLSSVMAAVEGIPFAEAQRRASSLFEEIRTDALTSVATTRELFTVFQGIYGPLANAGLATDEIRETMRNTVTAASALGVDLAQAQRDISAMVRGTAGVDVRLFSMLRSTGAIAENTEAFNALSAPERIDRVRQALRRFEEAGAAYGQSFAGVVSTFQDIVETLTAAFFGPGFARVRSFLAGLNTQLLANRSAIEGALAVAGEQVANHLQRAFDYIDFAMRYVRDHWDEIVAKGERLVQQFRSVIPQMIQAAQAFAAFTVARSALGAGLGAASGAMNLAALLGEGGVGLLGGGAAAGAGGAAAAGGAGGGLAALEGALAALGAVAAPIAAVLAAVAAAGYFVWERMSDFAAMFDMLRPALEAIWADFMSIGASLWELLRPLLKIVGGSLFIMLFGGLLLLIGGLRVLAATLAFVMEWLARFSNMIEEWIIDPLLDLLMRVARGITELVGTLFGTHQGPHQSAGTIRGHFPDGPPIDTRDPLDRLRDQIGDGTGMQFGRFAVPPSAVPADRRPVQHNDFRGSRITVHQEFRQADPDRVALQMIEDLNRQAEARIQSGFVPALTR